MNRVCADPPPTNQGLRKETRGNSTSIVSTLKRIVDTSQAQTLWKETYVKAKSSESVRRSFCAITPCKIHILMHGVCKRERERITIMWKWRKNLYDGGRRCKTIAANCIGLDSNPRALQSSTLPTRPSRHCYSGRHHGNHIGLPCDVFRNFRTAQWTVAKTKNPSVLLACCPTISYRPRWESLGEFHGPPLIVFRFIEPFKKGMPS